MEKLYLKRSWRIGTCLMVLLTFFAKPKGHWSRC